MFSSTSNTKFSVYSLYYIFLWNSTSPNNMIVLVLCISEVSGLSRHLRVLSAMELMSLTSVLLVGVVSLLLFYIW